MWQALLTGVSRKAARYCRSKPFRMLNRAPIVSFTFDDVPDSAYTNGASILEEHRVHGTFYIAAGTCGTTDDHWRVIERNHVSALHRQGHEIGCHTFSHVNVETLNARELQRECDHNRAVVRELCDGADMSNFCYPFGRLSLPRKWQLERRFDTCRGIYEGINAGTIDLSLLKVIELYDRTLTAEKLGQALRDTRERNGWLIFYTHDVADPPSWIGCSPALLRAAVAAIQLEGIRCLPIRDALKAIGYGAPHASAAARPKASADRPEIAR